MLLDTNAISAWAKWDEGRADYSLSQFARRTERGRDEGVIEPAAGKFVQLGNHRGDGIEKAGVFGAKEAAEQAGCPQAMFACGAPAKAFLQEDEGAANSIFSPVSHLPLVSRGPTRHGGEIP